MWAGARQARGRGAEELRDRPGYVGPRRPGKGLQFCFACEGTRLEDF